MSRSKWVLVAAFAVMMTAVPAAAEDEGRSQLEPGSTGWKVSGLDVGFMVDGESLGEVAAGQSLTQPVGENDRIYLYDKEGIPAGILSGRAAATTKSSATTAPTVDPLSYLIERSGSRSSLLVGWVPVTDADVYAVRLNDDGQLGETNGTEIRVPLDGLRLGDMIWVDAIDLDASHDQALIGSMGVVVSEFTLGRVGLEDAALTLDSKDSGISVTPFATTAALASTHYFRFTTFIPNQYAAIGFWEDLGCTLPSGAAYFGGDNRSYNYSASTYRSRVNVTWTWGTTTQSKNRFTLPTKVYNSAKTQIGSKTASTSGIEVRGVYPVDTANLATATEVRFHILHKAGNPWCTSLSSIDYNVDMYVERTAGYNSFTATGKNDRAPNYEFYYDDNTISPVRFRGWAMTANQFICLAACTQAGFSIVK